MRAFRIMVPRPGIEPGTRGFSIRCSTPELPGRATGEARYLTKGFELVHAVFSHPLTSLDPAPHLPHPPVRLEWHILQTTICSGRHRRSVLNRRAGTAQRQDSCGIGNISVGRIWGTQVYSCGLIYCGHRLRRGKICEALTILV